MSLSTAPILAGMGGHWEIWIIVLVVVLLFGSRIPKVARSLGQGISQFKKGLNDAQDEVNEAMDDVKKDDAKKLEGSDKSAS